MRIVLSLIVLLQFAAASTEAAGIQRIEVPGEAGAAPLVGAVWTPCAAPLETVRLRRLVVPGVKDCPLEGEGLPLVVLSHGAKGWFGGHHDTAAALADAGFAAVAITHPDEPGRAWRSGRPAAVKRLIDHMLETWPEGARLDASRIGFFGFSRGGYTGLVLVGGRPDFRLFALHCEAVPDDRLCQLTGRSAGGRAAGNAAPVMSPTHDRRIKAAVIAAPLGLVFDAEGLRDVTVPIQLWRPEHDVLASHPYNAEAVYQALPMKPDYRVARGAGHFAILAPCSPPQARAVPKLCNDAPGFDRVVFHKTFNAEIVSFFRTQLNAR